MDPTFLYEGLTVGTYTLTEMSAPDGYYVPADNTWTFEVVWNDETNRLEIVFETGDELADGKIKNYPKGQLPETGGSGNMQTLIVSIFAFSMLITLGIWRFKRDEVNGHD